MRFAHSLRPTGGFYRIGDKVSYTIKTPSPLGDGVDK